MTVRIEPREIRGLLQRDLTRLLGVLFPRWPVTTPIFTPLNPTRDDKRPGSFVIWTSGPAAGGFNEYSPSGPICHGDVIDLISYVNKCPGDRRFALRWARDFLGLEKMDPAELGRIKASARNQVSISNAAASQTSADRRKKAIAIWRRTLPIAGTAAEIYLASRRIAYQLIPNPEADLRFIPRLEHWKSAQWDRSTTPWTKLQDGYQGPAMVAAMRNLAGDITAVHCTFLRADGSGKADVSEPKLMRGDAKGSAIRLTRGSSNLPLEEALADGLIEGLGTGEGIENCLSCAFDIKDRIWAAGSFDLMMALPVDHAAFDPIYYLLDNDNNAQARDKVQDRIDELNNLGKAATAIRPPNGVKDFNDLIKGDDDDGK
ncbi:MULTISPECIES: toprim domain-containing protein [Rhodopseudomonas]|uniref:Uncharacterized protein n=1 Tax=Rhodopseudomonas palustris TaxID=1076 RepID=A0A0D7EEH6_RHOPL|nr:MULTISPECIES: toprim domain-containing protein [Rhodopseudomonas]KIZ39051.1 hypothetical protein OO17_21575 [Rhodopseudomonas palustris]MDF3809278.1 toprim domain-containing protein [Rhodopseudomonas sp. BAL398]WOK19038.1 toprim domain-containing protein [Rhodopseudomonas sp. BAL398]